MSATLSMNALCKQAAKMSFVSSMSGRQVSISKVAPVRKAVSQVVQVEAKTQKLKTCKAAAKRYKVTGTGKVMRRQAMKQHLLGKKSPARKHRLEGDEPLSKGEYTNVMGQIPHAGVKRPGNQRKAQASQ